MATLTPQGLKHFTCDPRGERSSMPAEVRAHLLRGTWQESTLRHYESAVRKLLAFAKAEGISRQRLLPVQKKTLARFVVWCSFKHDSPDLRHPPIAATTIRSYIARIKVWHDFHSEPFPMEAEKTVSLLLRSNRRLEARYVDWAPPRPPVMLQDLATLTNRGNLSSGTGSVAFAVATVAFWGVARLGELVSDKASKRLPIWGDLVWAADRLFVKIALFEAKTASPGGVQYIHLQRQNSSLDAVAALESLYTYKRPTLCDEVFARKVDGQRKRLTKKEVMAWCKAEWLVGKNGGLSGEGLSGHSFRIGGASMRWNLGTEEEQLKKAGRWKSDSFRLYLRRYLRGELKDTKRRLRS